MAIDPETNACIGGMNSDYHQVMPEDADVTTRPQLVLRRITDIVTQGDRLRAKELMRRYSSSSKMAADPGLEAKGGSE